MGADKKKQVLLFYKEYEKDKFIKYDRYLKRALRPVYNLFHNRQKNTGSVASFSLLRRALEGSTRANANKYLSLAEKSADA